VRGERTLESLVMAETSAKTVAAKRLPPPAASRALIAAQICPSPAARPSGLTTAAEVAGYQTRCKGARPSPLSTALLEVAGYQTAAQKPGGQAHTGRRDSLRSRGRECASGHGGGALAWPTRAWRHRFALPAPLAG